MKPITIVKYETLKDCFLDFIGEPDITDDELKSHQWEGYNCGRKYNVNAYKWLNNPKVKCWGWAQYYTKSIHIWIDKDCKIDELLKLLAHETAHLMKPRPKDKREEERKASRTAQCAEFAYRFAKDILNNK